MTVDEIRALVTEENMRGCIEEIAEVFIRRGIAADCLLASPTETVSFRHEYPPKAS